LSRFELKPSFPLAVAIVVAHAAAAASAFASLGGAAGALLAAALLGFGLAVAWSRALLRAAASVRAIEVDAGAVTLELADRARLPAEIGERRYVSRWLVTLPVRRPSRRTVLVTRGMLGEPAFRRLRLWALWGRVPAAAAVH
jgi:hypothetical protein